MSVLETGQEPQAGGGEPEDAAPDVDPVTFEGIRHRLWAINDD